MADANHILDEAMKLPEGERTEVALELLDSIDPPDPLADLDDEQWAAEIERRAKRAISGESTGSSWSDVRKRIERKLDT